MGQRKSSTRRAWASASMTWCSTRHSRSSARTVPSPSAQSLSRCVRRDAKGQEAKYRRYDFPRTFTAKQVGPITLGAVTLQGTFANDVSDTGRLRGKEIYAASKPLAILVKDVPHKRPARELRRSDRPFPLGCRIDAAEVEGRRPDHLHARPQRIGLAGRGETARLEQGAGGRRAFQGLRGDAEDGRGYGELRLLAPALERRRRAVSRRGGIVFRRRSKGDMRRCKAIPSRSALPRPSSFPPSRSSRRRAWPGKRPRTWRPGGKASLRTSPTPARSGIKACGPSRGWRDWEAVWGSYVLVAAVTVFIRRRTQDKSALRRRAAAPRARQQLRAATAQWQARRVREAADLVQDSLAGLVADVAGLRRRRPDRQGRTAQLQAWAD